MNLFFIDFDLRTVNVSDNLPEETVHQTSKSQTNEICKSSSIFFSSSSSRLDQHDSENFESNLNVFSANDLLTNGTLTFSYFRFQRTKSHDPSRPIGTCLRKHCPLGVQPKAWSSITFDLRRP